MIFARDDNRSADGDKVSCGSGTDTVYANDKKDKIASDCETVRRSG